MVINGLTIENVSVAVYQDVDLASVEGAYLQCFHFLREPRQCRRVAFCLSGLFSPTQFLSLEAPRYLESFGYLLHALFELVCKPNGFHRQLAVVAAFELGELALGHIGGSMGGRG